MVGCVVEHTQEQICSSFALSFGCGVSFAELLGRQTRNADDGPIENSSDKGDDVCFGIRFGLGVARLGTSEGRQKIIQALAQMRDLASEAHLGRCQLKVEVGGGHGFGHFDSKIARGLEVFDDGGLEVGIGAEDSGGTE